MIITFFIGPPAVGTPKKIIKEILAEIKPKQGSLFIDLGSGSGQVIRIAVKKYRVTGLGIEINPLLVLWSKIMIFLENSKGITFKRKNYLAVDLSSADTIFFYLLPKYLPPVVEKIEKECRKNTLVVSQRFKVEKWTNKLIKEMNRKNNSTYIYKL